MSLRLIAATLLLALCCGLAVPALAKSTHAKKSPDPGHKSLGIYGGWHAYRSDENHQPVCYMALAYAPPKIAKFHRTTGHLTITHRPADNSKDVVSYNVGYVFKPDQPAIVHIGKSHYELFTTRDSAWTRDAVTDHRLAAAIRQNFMMTISGKPNAKVKGLAVITDHLQLSGAAQAYQAINKACGYEVEKAVVKATPKGKTRRRK